MEREVTSINYFMINHQNKITFFQDEEKNNFMLLLYTTLVSMVDEEIGNNIGKLFTNILHSKNKDLLQINKDLCKHYIKTYNIPLNKDNVYDTINKILDKNYKLTFEFTPENTQDISLIIAYIYLYTKFKKYQIKSYDDIVDKAKEYRQLGFDLPELYRDKKTKIINNLQQGNETVNITPRKNYSSSKIIYTYDRYNNVNEENVILNSNDEFILTNKLFDVRETLQFDKQNDVVNNVFGDVINKDEDDSNYIYPYLDKEVQKKLNFNIPLEMCLLINKFESIVKLIIKFDQIDLKRRDEFLLIFLNINWLFPFALNLDLDLHNRDLYDEILNIHKKKLTKVEKETRYDLRTTHYTHDPNILKKNMKYNMSYTVDVINDDESVDDFSYADTPTKRDFSMTFGNEEIYKGDKKVFKAKNNSKVTKFVTENSQYYEVLIILLYFIEQVHKNIRILTLTLYNSYLMELEDLIKIEKLDILNLFIMNYFIKVKSVIDLDLTFNSLDLKVFERVLGILNVNELLSQIKINFFIEDKYYSPEAIYHLCRNLKINIKKILIKKRKYTLGEQTEIDNSLIEFLLPFFEDNIHKLFYILYNKSKLEEAMFYFDIPSALTYNDSFCITIVKFILDFLFLLSFEKNKYRKIHIYAPFIKFDSRNISFLEDLIGELDMNNNQKLQIFNFQVQMFDLYSVKNLISCNLMQLFLGDLDHRTFSYFIEYYTSDEFLSKSKLTQIKIGLGVTVVIYDEVKDSIRKYFTHKTSKMKEQNLVSHLILRNTREIDDLFNIIFFDNRVEMAMAGIEKILEYGSENNLVEYIYERKENILKKINIIMSVFEKRFKCSDVKNIRNKLKAFMNPENKYIFTRV